MAAVLDAPVANQTALEPAMQIRNLDFYYGKFQGLKKVSLDLARNLNSSRTSLVHIGHYNYDTSGNMTLYPAYITAAMISGAFSGVNPGTPLTNKALKVRGLERELRNPCAWRLVVYWCFSARSRMRSAVLSLIRRLRHVPFSTALTVEGEMPEMTDRS